MNKKTNILILTILFITLGLTTVYHHEIIHQDISMNHECKESIIGITWGGMYQQCLAYNPRTYETKLQEEYLHSLNELVTYHFIMLILLVYLTLVYKEITK